MTYRSDGVAWDAPCAAGYGARTVDRPGRRLPARRAAHEHMRRSSAVPFRFRDAGGGRRGQGAGGRPPIAAANDSGSPSNPLTVSRNSHTPEAPRANSATVAAVAAPTAEKSPSDRLV